MPLLALAGASCLIGVLLLGATLGRVVERAECQDAADASALAGVAEGRVQAEQLAVANDAVVLSFDADGNTVEVWVECGGVRAAASAERRLEPAHSE